MLLYVSVFFIPCAKEALAGATPNFDGSEYEAMDRTETPSRLWCQTIFRRRSPSGRRSRGSSLRSSGAERPVLILLGTLSPLQRKPATGNVDDAIVASFKKPGPKYLIFQFNYLKDLFYLMDEPFLRPCCVYGTVEQPNTSDQPTRSRC